MVYTGDLKSLTVKGLRVRVPLPALRHPKFEHVSNFVDDFAAMGQEGERWGPASTRGCVSVVRRRKVLTKTFRALDRVPFLAQIETRHLTCYLFMFQIAYS